MFLWYLAFNYNRYIQRLSICNLKTQNLNIAPKSVTFECGNICCHKWKTPHWNTYKGFKQITGVTSPLRVQRPSYFLQTLICRLCFMHTIIKMHRKIFLVYVHKICMMHKWILCVDFGPILKILIMHIQTFQNLKLSKIPHF